MEAKVVKLKKPIQFGSQTYTEIRFERPLKAKDLKNAPVGDMRVGHILDMVASLAGIPPSALGDLEGEDLPAVLDAAMSFFPTGLGIGPTA